MTKKKSIMKTWRCPKCSAEIQALAISVSHSCKYNKNTVTVWEEVSDEV